MGKVNMENMVSDGLVACPFCFGLGAIDEDMGIGPYWVVCADCGAEGPYKDRHAEAIAAWNLRSKPVAGVEVKPLEWERLPDTEGGTPHWSARTPFGVFQVYGEPNFGRAFKGVSSVSTIGGAGHDDPDAIKAMFEADYRQRILSALSISVQEPVAWVADYRKSDGTTDYFVMIGKDGREMSLHMHRIRGRADYEAAEINHAVIGTAKPEFDDFEVDGRVTSSQPEAVITEEVVERLFQAVMPFTAGTAFRELRTALTAALAQP